MKFEIRNRYTGNVQFVAEIEAEENASHGDKVGMAVKWAIKNKANLQEANLQGAFLQGANLKEADLQGANLDFSCLPLWCGCLKANMDDKQVIQILYHALSIAKNSNNVSKELKESLLTENNLKIANEFHRKECERL